MANVNCNLCGADDFTVVFPKGYAQLHRIVRCNRCGLMYSNPQELIDCERFQEPEYPKVFDEQQSRQYFRKQHVQLPDNMRALAVVESLRPNRGKLLEIGSYCGIFLDQIRSHGWDATGLEPDRGAADYSRAKYGHNIIDGVLPQPALAEGTFDAVVLLHVIEHIPDPSSALREIRRILRPGGVLVVETPRFDSLLFKLLGRRERSICNCNGHIYFFTVPTLTQMLEKSGFEIAKVELVGRTLTLDRFLYNVGLVTRSQAIKEWLYSAGRKFGLEKMTFHVNFRDMQRIYVRAK